MDDKEKIRLKMQSQANSQLIAIVENPKDWPKDLVYAATLEIAGRGGLQALKAKIEAGDDSSTITVVEREQITAIKQKNGYIKIGFTIIAAIALTLPFHWVLTAHFTVFPKDNLTFTNTFIFQSDINRLVDNYNDKNLFQQLIDKDDPLTKKLVEKGVIKQE